MNCPNCTGVLANGKCAVCGLEYVNPIEAVDAEDSPLVLVDDGHDDPERDEAPAENHEQWERHE